MLMVAGGRYAYHYEAKEESYKEATRSALKQARALTKARALDE